MHEYSYDYIILGAGISGLSAAYELHKKNKRFIVLEARDRIGGRIYTKHVDTPDGPIGLELGAGWIGKYQKTIQELCAELHLTLIPQEAKRDIFVNGKYITEDDRHYNKLWKKHAYRALWHINNKYSKEQLRELDNMSFGDYLKSTKINKFDYKTMELLEGTMMGAHIEKLSAYTVLYHHLSLGIHESEGDDFSIEGGNSKLPEAIAQKIGEKNILLDTQITHIAHAPHNITLTDSRGIIFHAKKLIITLPTKPLLHINWSPALPEQLTSAWRNLRYATITKNHQVFSKRFWHQKSLGVFTDTIGAEVIHSTAHQPNHTWGALCAYAYDTNEEAFLELSEEQQIKKVLEALQLEPKNSEYFLETIRHIWSHDPFSRGAYAYYQPGQYLSGMVETMKTPVGNMYFTGEHLAEDVGYMNGAIEQSRITVRDMLHKK
ncbi:MAG: NAD(P)/FAD-dependent oxidoreductase [Candidatus Andersenbacteria bacterium]